MSAALVGLLYALGFQAIAGAGVVAGIALDHWLRVRRARWAARSRLGMFGEGGR